MVVDHQLVASVEQVPEADGTVGPDDRDAFLDAGFETIDTAGNKVNFTKDGDQPGTPDDYCVRGNNLSVRTDEGEVYTAIQSGVLDGAENNPLIYSSLSHDEIAPYYSLTQHLMMPDYLIGSPAVWDALDEETKGIFQELLDTSVDTELEAFAAAVDEATAAAEEAGATVNEVDIEAFREAVRPLHEERVTTDVTRAIYDAIEAARG